MNTRELIINALLYIDRVYLKDEYYAEYQSEMTLDEYIDREMKALYTDYDKKTDSDLLIELLYTHSDVQFDSLRQYIKNF